VQTLDGTEVMRDWTLFNAAGQRENNPDQDTALRRRPRAATDGHSIPTVSRASASSADSEYTWRLGGTRSSDDDSMEDAAESRALDDASRRLSGREFAAYD